MTERDWSYCLWLLCITLLYVAATMMGAREAREWRERYWQEASAHWDTKALYSGYLEEWDETIPADPDDPDDDPTADDEKDTVLKT